MPGVCGSQTSQEEEAWARTSYVTKGKSFHPLGPASAHPCGGNTGAQRAGCRCLRCLTRSCHVTPCLHSTSQRSLPVSLKITPWCKQDQKSEVMLPAQGVTRPLALLSGSKSQAFFTLPRTPSKFKVYVRHCYYRETRPRCSVVPVGPGAPGGDGRVAAVEVGDIEKPC